MKRPLSLLQRLVFSLLLLIGLGFITYTSKANVSTYTFASATTTYTAIGGTTLYSGTWDDAASSLITLPFTFTYNGLGYTTLSVSTNGFLTLGAVPATTYCGLQGSAVNSIAAYGTDLVNGSTSSVISYVISGSAPNRQFIAQWSDCKHYNGGADHYSFQIILNENGNTIQVVWGPVTAVSTMGANTCSDAATESGDVGLLGASISDFNIRSITNGSNDWNSSVTGTAISAVCNMSPTNFPSQGLTYTWTPPVPVPMSFTSCNTVMLNNGEVNGQGTTNNRIVQLQVLTSGSLSPLNVTAMQFATTGSTNPGSDITNARVYFTGTSSSFSTLTPFGSVIPTPNGTYTLTGNVTLGEGINYFWVTYDIASGATIGNTLKACCPQVTGSGAMGVRTPTVSCPAGAHTVGVPVGYWTALNNPAPASSGGVMLMLSDGTVMCKSSSGGDSYGNLWNKLIPDASGSYINGTWTTLAPMNYTRLYFSSQVLKDGRVYVAGGEYGTGGSQGEVYNPLTNTWTLTPAPGQTVSDANSEILNDGRVVQALVAGSLTSTVLYNPQTNTYSAGPSTNGIHNESVWLKLADNSILFVDRLSTSSERYIPASNTWVNDATVPVSLYDPYGDETGGAVLLPDGRGFFIGSTGHTAYYTPSGSSSAGSWSAGPDIPGGQGVPDGAAAMMSNGKILLIVSPVPTSANHFPPPTAFYEFDYLSNTFTQINTPYGGTTTNISCYITNLLDLPDGNVLFSTQGSSQYYVYTPGSGPLPAGKPVISAIQQTGCSTFSITGTKFNGISEGATYGDDWQMATNYPIIRLSNGSAVYYCRTFNWNATGVQRGSLPDTVQFTLPAGLPVGTYSLVVTANGIPSNPVLFTPTPYLSSSLTATSCSGSLYTYVTQVLPATASYSWTRAAVAGISNAAVTIPQTGNPNEVLVNTTSNPLNVVYTFTLNSNGCVNTQQVTVSVNPATTTSTTASACTSYIWFGTTYTTSGNYTHTSLNANGCPNTDTLHLTITSTTNTSTTASACTSFIWFGTTYTTSGNYTHTSLNANGCLNTDTLHLTINSTTTTSATISACTSYVWFGATYTVSGNYTHNSLNANGCLNTDTLHLTINSTTTTSATISACNSYVWFGTTYTTSGNYTHTSLNVNGCPNTDTLHLTINSTTTTFATIIACTSYIWFGTSYTTSGNYTHTSLNANGCLNTDTLHLTINSTTTTFATIIACTSYIWFGATYTVSGNYTHTSLNANGCLNTDTLHLTINSTTTSSTTASACNSYVWFGTTYTVSGNYTHTSLNSNGCLNTDTLHLTINLTTTSSTTSSACNSYVWFGTTYTVSGNYTHTSLNANGCLNTDTLHLTINLTTTSSTTASACTSYIWFGATYTTSGNYTHTSLNANGCLNTDTLHLTINLTTTSSTTASACNSYVWFGATYTTSGNYTHTSLNANGCLNTDTLHLTINLTTNTSTTSSTCNSYVWFGTTYTTSGNYTHTSLNANGCLNTDTLHLTINLTTTSSTTSSSCNSYIWFGATYTTSGNYTHTSLNANGCANTDTLHLTINSTTTTSATISACTSYVWFGATYTTSGNYTHTSLNANGCLNTDTLHLTINLTTTSSTTASACNSYVWFGTTYTTSGNYTHTTLNANGCLNTDTLHVTINASVLQIISVSATGCYTWAVNGNTYSNSGTYTYTQTVSGGCDTVLSLHLTINPGVYLYAKVFLSGPYSVNTGWMTDSLRQHQLIPLTEPYTSMPYNKMPIGDPGGESVSQMLMDQTGADAMVDWIFLELRSVSNPAQVVANRRAILQRDGDVVATDGYSPVLFSTTTPGYYYISIKHRNHIGIMSASAIYLNGCNPVTVDFTGSSGVYVNPAINNAPRRLLGSVYALWAGDANNNKNSKYNGLSNDKDPVLNTVGTGTPNNILYDVYRMEDVNLDGRVKYNGTDNDRAAILENIGPSTPNNILFQHTPN